MKIKSFLIEKLVQSSWLEDISYYNRHNRMFPGEEVITFRVKGNPKTYIVRGLTRHDYIEWIKYLRAEYPFVNADKVGITGFSYGGSMTTLACTEGSDYFKYGIAGGGVYDYQLYDTHYAERYMDRPQDNPEGYANTVLGNRIAKYKGDKTNYLKITHGTSDDNVHMQNTMHLINAMQDAGKQFDLMMYPGEFHGYRGKKSVHSKAGDYIFWYRHLLEKEAPAILLP